MYLYNTTFVINNNELDWWAGWMKRHYLPTFFEVTPNAVNDIFRLEMSADSESTTFSCQWRCNTLQELGEIRKYSESLHRMLTEQKGESCLTFSTMMKSVEL